MHIFKCSMELKCESTFIILYLRRQSINSNHQFDSNNYSAQFRLNAYDDILFIIIFTIRYVPDDKQKEKQKNYDPQWITLERGCSDTIEMHCNFINCKSMLNPDGMSTCRPRIILRYWSKTTTNCIAFEWDNGLNVAQYYAID